MKKLQEMLAGYDLTELEGITEPVQDGDNVVAVLNDDLKRLCGLCSVAFKETEKLSDEVQTAFRNHQREHHTTSGCGKGPDCERFRRDMEVLVDRIQIAQAKMSTLKNILYELIRLEYPEVSTKPYIALRLDYQVVWREPEEVVISLDLEDILRQMQGEGRRKSNE